MLITKLISVNSDTFLDLSLFRIKVIQVEFILHIFLLMKSSFKNFEQIHPHNVPIVLKALNRSMSGLEALSLTKSTPTT